MSKELFLSKLLPPPAKRERLVIDEVFSLSEGEKMREGFVPRDMDDRWGVHRTGDWVNFHRSWTGAHIFALKLERNRDVVRVVDAWASRDEEQYKSTSAEADRDTVVRLARMLFGD